MSMHGRLSAAAATSASIASMLASATKIGNITITGYGNSNNKNNIIIKIGAATSPDAQHCIAATKRSSARRRATTTKQFMADKGSVAKSSKSVRKCRSELTGRRYSSFGGRIFHGVARAFNAFFPKVYVCMYERNCSIELWQKLQSIAGAKPRSLWAPAQAFVAMSISIYICVCLYIQLYVYVCTASRCCKLHSCILIPCRFVAIVVVVLFSCYCCCCCCH